MKVEIVDPNETAGDTFTATGSTEQGNEGCNLQHTACWVKFSADYILKYLFLLAPEKKGFDISCKLSPEETICMECQNLLSGKNKKTVINLSSADLA